MKLKTIAYAAFIAAAAGAFVIGSSGRSEAKKKMAAAPPPPGPCFDIYAPVCGAKGGMKFTYANACLAAKDGAAVVSKGACPKVVKHKKYKKKMAKPEKKTEMKKPAARRRSGREEEDVADKSTAKKRAAVMQRPVSVLRERGALISCAAESATFPRSAPWSAAYPGI